MAANVNVNTTSWGDQVEVALPAGATGEHYNESQRSNNVPKSYADAAARNTGVFAAPPPPVDPQEDTTTLSKRSFLTEIEKQHFHPNNVTPDRPCTAYFNLADNTITTKEILAGLVSDDISINAVRCLQRNPAGFVQITFSTPEHRESFLQKSSFIVRKSHCVAHPAGKVIIFVNIFDAPYELSDNAIVHRLKKYGIVHSQRRGKVQGYFDIYNGTRTYGMTLFDNWHIPCYIRFGRFQVRVKYSGQPATCRKCGDDNHLAKDCRTIACFNCDGIGHTAKECQRPTLCCICKEGDYMAIDCPFSWNRRPKTHTIEDPTPPEVQPTETSNSFDTQHTETAASADNPPVDATARHSTAPVEIDTATLEAAPSATSASADAQENTEQTCRLVDSQGLLIQLSKETAVDTQSEANLDEDEMGDTPSIDALHMAAAAALKKVSKIPQKKAGRRAPANVSESPGPPSRKNTFTRLVTSKRKTSNATSSEPTTSNAPT